MQLSPARAYPEMPGEKSVRDSVVAISRRDTVIIAMLVNMALLFVLFASSVKSETSVDARPHVEKKEEPSRQENKTFQTVPQIVSPPRQLTASPADEIDEILQQYMRKQEQQPKAVSVKQLIPQKAATPIEKKQVEKAPLQKVIPAQTEPKKATEVKIQQGDSLAKIAKANGVTVEGILEYNQLSNSKLRIGQVVKIPPVSIKAKKPPVPEPVVSEAVPQYYILKSGDNPWTLARKFHLKFEDLLKLNNLDEEKARNLKVGQKIRIR